MIRHSPITENHSNSKVRMVTNMQSKIEGPVKTLSSRALKQAPTHIYMIASKAIHSLAPYPNNLGYTGLRITILICTCMSSLGLF